MLVLLTIIIAKLLHVCNGLRVRLQLGSLLVAGLPLCGCAHAFLSFVFFLSNLFIHEFFFFFFLYSLYTLY
uniref:Hypothetical secreted protein n=1 Tax=Glossina morsitans morsitans TaxID=37546 RepID=D3TM17_GLOMM